MLLHAEHEVPYPAGFAGVVAEHAPLHPMVPVLVCPHAFAGETQDCPLAKEHVCPSQLGLHMEHDQEHIPWHVATYPSSHTLVITGHTSNF